MSKRPPERPDDRWLIAAAVCFAISLVAQVAVLVHLITAHR